MTDQPTTVYGASDDLIEFRGAIYDEFGFFPSGDESRLIAFSDGTVLRISFTEYWTLSAVKEGHLFDALHPCHGEDNPHADHRPADAATLKPGIQWAILGDTLRTEQAQGKAYTLDLNALRGVRLPRCEENAVLGLSDGTAFRVSEDQEGMLRLTAIAHGTLFERMQPATQRGQSDVAFFRAGVCWVVMGDEFARARK